jgi:hypothetical protein
MNIGLIPEIVVTAAILSFGAAGVLAPIAQTRYEFLNATRATLDHVRRVEAFQARAQGIGVAEVADPRLSIDIVEAVRRLHEKVRAAGLACEGLRPEGARRTERDGWHSRRTSVSLIVAGEEAGVRSFIDDVERDPGMAGHAVALAIRPDSQNAGHVRAEVLVEIVDGVRCVGMHCGEEEPGIDAPAAKKPLPALRRLFMPLKVEVKTLPTVADPESEIRKFKLIGVMDDGETHAFLREEGAASSVSVKKGDDVRGWTVTSIGPQGVEVRCEEREARIGT